MAGRRTCPSRAGLTVEKTDRSPRLSKIMAKKLIKSKTIRSLAPRPASSVEALRTAVAARKRRREAYKLLVISQQTMTKKKKVSQSAARLQKNGK